MKVTRLEHEGQQVFDTAPIPILVIDADGNIILVNAAARKLLAIGEPDLINIPLSRVLPNLDVSELTRNAQPAGANNQPKLLDASGENTDPFFVQICASAWRTADDQPRYTLTLDNITEQHVAGQRHREDMKRCENALTGAEIGVFEVDLETGESIVSESWRTLMGVSDKPDIDAQAEWLARIHPEDLSITEAADIACIKGLSQRSLTEYRMKNRAGNGWRWMCSDAIVSKRDASGRALRLLGAQTDITERKKTEEALRLSKEQFQSAFENAPIGKAIVGLDGSWMKVNTALCDLFGYKEAELLQTDFQSLTLKEDLEADIDQVQQLLAGNKSSYSKENRYIRSDGAIIWGLLSVTLVHDETGAPAHFVSQIVDITEQRQLSTLKDQFVATVSHELRTPLTSLLGALDLLTHFDKGLSDETSRLIYLAQTSGERLRYLVNDILDFEKISAGQMEFAISQQRIVDLVEHAVFAALPYAKQFGVRFEIERSDRRVTGATDPDRFQQVISNLLSNAAKFSDKSTPVEIGIQNDGAFVRVSVTNSGVEIPADLREAIFKPFQQVAQSATRKRGGTGLGLSISKQLVEQMGGKLNLESSNGMITFWFTVPTKQKAAFSQAAPL